MTPYKKVYGLTGGIASGKSTLTKLLRQEGELVVDMDQISRRIFDQSSPAYSELLEEFGQDILDSRGEVDRKKLSQIVFTRRDRLEALNKISHPHIMAKAKDQVLQALKTRDLVFVDIPLLFETREELSSYGLDFYKTILVYVDRQTQLERLIKRDGIDSGEANRIIDSQMDIEKKRNLADLLINNLGSREDLELELKKFLASI